MNEIYEKVNDLQGFIRLMGAAIAHSGFYGCKNEQQGCVIAWHCVVTGESPLVPMQEFDVFNTATASRLRKKSEAMLRTFHKRGGESEWKSNGKNGTASLLLKRHGKEMLSEYSLEDAKTALLLDGKNPNWKTRPQNMLRSRAVSEGLRMFDPESCEGCYTPEEIEDAFGNDESATATTATTNEPASTPERKTRKKSEPATTATATESSAATTGAASAGTSTSNAATATTQSTQVDPADAERAVAVATAATTEPASAPKIPQIVIDIIALRDYVGPRWPVDNKNGPWPQLWDRVRSSLNVPPGETDEERFTKANEAVRTKVTTWLNQQRVTIDQLAASKDLSTWANQTPAVNPAPGKAA